MDSNYGVMNQWINREYFQKLLRLKYSDEELKVLRIHIEDACEKGTNYCSKIYRIKIEYSAHSKPFNQISFVLKVQLPAEEGGNTLDKYKLFEKELIIFDRVLPLTYETIGVQCSECGLAASLFGFDTMHKSLMFEDLCEKNYQNMVRGLTLSFDYMMLILKKLSLWHAVTAVKGEEDENLINGVLQFPNVCHEITDFHDVFIKSLSCCSMTVRKWEGCKSIADKLQKLSTEIIEKLSKVYTSNPSEFNVLNHGDLWTNNIMFEWGSNSKLLEVIFVDYATAFWGGPGIDLAYLFFTSSENSVFEELDNLIVFYYEWLTKYLLKYKYSRRVPNSSEIRNSVFSKSYYGIAVSTFLRALQVVDDVEKATIENFISETREAEEFRKQLFNNPKYKNTMLPLLSYLDRHGYLD